MIEEMKAKQEQSLTESEEAGDPSMYCDGVYDGWTEAILFVQEHREKQDTLFSVLSELNKGQVPVLTSVNRILLRQWLLMLREVPNLFHKTLEELK